MPTSVRQELGALGIDLPRFEWLLRKNWLLIRNRSESLELSPDGIGARCCWRWTSDLHVAKVFPGTGRRLLQRVLADWPIVFANASETPAAAPQVTFVIGHRGNSRLPHLIATLRAIAAQRGVACECVVVEQSDEPEAGPNLPPWVRYVHTRPSERAMPYNRAWALNTGARLARGKLLVFHDNDMLVPQEYASELWKRYQAGYEVVNLKRFVFYLDPKQTTRFFETVVLDSRAGSETIVQNLEAGGSVAVCRTAFFSLGGFDEAFVGWGGEDNEFWERALTRKAWPFGYLPIVHLWHAAQPRKSDPGNPTLLRYAARAAMAPERRIEDLRSREFGSPGGSSLSGGR